MKQDIRKVPFANISLYMLLFTGWLNELFFLDKLPTVLLWCRWLCRAQMICFSGKTFLSFALRWTTVSRFLTL